MVVDNPKLDNRCVEVANELEVEEALPPKRESDDGASHDSDGFMLVAGDGACPGG